MTSTIRKSAFTKFERIDSDVIELHRDGTEDGDGVKGIMRNSAGLICATQPLKFYNKLTKYQYLDGEEYYIVRGRDELDYIIKKRRIPLENIVTTFVLNMSELFADKSVDGDITSWDTSNVLNMSRMFANSPEFNQDISGWNTGRVYRMDCMFEDCASFNQDISGWNTGRVFMMSGMFRRAYQFNQNISGWDISSVCDMTGMFHKAYRFNHSVVRWGLDGGKIKGASDMFLGALSYKWGQ